MNLIKMIYLCRVWVSDLAGPGRFSGMGIKDVAIFGFVSLYKDCADLYSHFITITQLLVHYKLGEGYTFFKCVLK